MAAATIVRSRSRIAWPYTFYFLWLEPFLLLLSGLQVIFKPIEHVFVFTVPRILDIPTAFKPLMYELGSVEICMAGFQAVILRQAFASGQLDIFNANLAFMMFGDMIHCYSMVATMGRQFFQPWLWRAVEWPNVGGLLIALPLRAAFLFGVGVHFQSRQEKAA